MEEKREGEESIDEILAELNGLLNKMPSILSGVHLPEIKEPQEIEPPQEREKKEKEQPADSEAKKPGSDILQPSSEEFVSLSVGGEADENGEEETGGIEDKLTEEPVEREMSDLREDIYSNESQDEVPDINDLLNLAGTGPKEKDSGGEMELEEEKNKDDKEQENIEIKAEEEVEEDKTIVAGPEDFKHLIEDNAQAPSAAGKGDEQMESSQGEVPGEKDKEMVVSEEAQEELSHPQVEGESQENALEKDEVHPQEGPVEEVSSGNGATEEMVEEKHEEVQPEGINEEESREKIPSEDLAENQEKEEILNVPVENKQEELQLDKKEEDVLTEKPESVLNEESVSLAEVQKNVAEIPSPVAGDDIKENAEQALQSAERSDENAPALEIETSEIPAETGTTKKSAETLEKEERFAMPSSEEDNKLENNDKTVMLEPGTSFQESAQTQGDETFVLRPEDNPQFQQALSVESEGAETMDNISENKPDEAIPSHTIRRQFTGDIHQIIERRPPDNVPEERIKPLVFLYAMNEEPLLGEVLNAMDEICLKSETNPMFVKRAKVLVIGSGMEGNYAEALVKDNNALGLICIGSVPSEVVYEIENVFNTSKIFFKHISAQNYSYDYLIDIICELILL